MKKYLFFFVFVSLAQLFYGQQKFTIRGEFPDNSLDGKYVMLADKSFLTEEYKRKQKASDEAVKILVTDKKFYYEGTTARKPFLAQIYYDRPRFSRQTSYTSFVIEPGDIHIRITDWYGEGNVSGTPINEDYNSCIIERQNLINGIRQTIISKKYTLKEDELLSLNSAYERSKEGELIFLEKYAQYPDVIRVMLSRNIDVYGFKKELDVSEYLHILDLMPEADRDILLSWRDYTKKRGEYFTKRKALSDSLKRNAPRFIENIEYTKLK